MERRAVGVAVLTVALLLAVVVPNLRPRVVPGAAQAEPVPGPPAVGDCVTETFDPSTADRTWPLPKHGHDKATAKCAGARYGEVVAVIANPLPFDEQARQDATQATPVPDQATCVAAIIRYVGFPADKGGTLKPMSTYWYPSLMLGLATSSPSPTQQTAGQHWLACIANLQNLPETEATVPRYEGSLKDALLTGRPRNVLTTCNWGPAGGQNNPDGRCVKPHTGETLASGKLDGHPVARAALEASCRKLVGQLTGIAGLSAVKELHIAMAAVDPNGAELKADVIPGLAFLSCGVTSTRPLKGSLLGIGATPIPWA